MPRKQPKYIITLAHPFAPQALAEAFYPIIAKRFDEKMAQLAREAEEAEKAEANQQSA